MAGAPDISIKKTPGISVYERLDNGQDEETTSKILKNVRRGFTSLSGTRKTERLAVKVRKGGFALKLLLWESICAFASAVGEHLSI